jgi:hypothetical protein
LVAFSSTARHKTVAFTPSFAPKLNLSHGTPGRCVTGGIDLSGSRELGWC